VLDCEPEIPIQLDDELLEAGANHAADDVEDVLPPKRDWATDDIDDMSGLDRANSAA